MAVPSADQPTSEAVLAELPATLAAGLEIIAVRALGDADEARDAVQESLTRALAAIRDGRVPLGVPIAAFVYGIARHVIADVHRRRLRDGPPGVDPAHLHATDLSPLDVLIQREEMHRVQRALAKLPAADRELLDRCFVRGERVAAIAAQSGEPADRIRKRKERALERLRQGLQGDRVGHETPSAPTLAT